MDGPELRDEDVVILRYLAEGMTARDIAACVGEPDRRVQRRVRSIRERLEAATNVHAVALAVRHGII